MKNFTVTTTKFPTLLTLPEVARNLRVHSTTVRAWILKGDLEAVQLPNGKYRIKEETLLKMLPEN